MKMKQQVVKKHTLGANSKKLQPQGWEQGKKRFPHSISIARCCTAHQQSHDAPAEPQFKLSVLWNGGTDGARTVHADAAKLEAAGANGRQEGRGNRKGEGEGVGNGRVPCRSVCACVCM